MQAPTAPRRIELSGSPRERGQRHGELLSREIRGLRRALLQYLCRLTLGLGGLPLLRALELLARLAFWSRIPPRLQDELKGVAAGAQVNLSLVVLINVLDDLANNWPACSALAVGEGRTSRGSYLIGRNLDYPVFVDVLVDLQTLFLTSPDQGLPLASLAWPGYVGILTGMNRAGLTLVQLTAMCRDHTLKGCPAGLRRATARPWSRRIFPAGLDRRPARDQDNHRQQCAAGGPQEALVLELSPHRDAVRRPRAGLITVTNHFQSHGMAPVKGLFPRRPPRLR